MIDTKMKPNQWIAALIVCFGLTFISYEGLSAHPHVFIVERIKIVFDDKGLAGFRIQWEFDDMFTSMIAGDHDKNQNNILESAEVAAIKENAFSYTSNQDYFTFVKIDGKPFKISYINEFSAKLIDTKLVYEFFVPCHVVGTSSMKQVIVASYDPTYYSAIYFAEKKPASMEQGDKFNIRTAIREDASTSIYYGMVHPWALFLEFNLKP